MRSVTGAHLRDMHEPAQEELEEQRQLEVPLELREAFCAAVEAVDPSQGVRSSRVSFDTSCDLEPAAIRKRDSGEAMRLKDLRLVAWIPQREGGGMGEHAWYAYLPGDKTADSPVELVLCA